jgi:transposase
MKIQKEVQRVWQSLSRRRRRGLRAMAKGNTDAAFRCRCQIVIGLVHGRSVATIQGVLQCSSSQVYRIAHRFVDQGESGLADRREDNGEVKADEEYAGKLCTAVAGSPRDHGYLRPTWTQELLIQVLEKQTGVHVSSTTMSRLLKRLKVRLGRPKPIVGCPWKKARRTRRLNALRRLVNNLRKDEVVLYVDEVDIHLNPKIGLDWMLPGTQKQVLTPGKNQKRYLAGALNARTGRLTWVEAEKKNSDLFILQLWTLIGRDYPGAKRIHLILDNYRIHSSQHTRLALSRLNGRIVLHFLPPYCPDHNRIERVWRDLHDNVTRNHTCRTMNELMTQVNHYLAERDQQLQTQYADRLAA